MIGLFKITDKRDGESYVLAESQMEKAFKGKFYIPPIYRESCSNIANGDVIFGVLDDQSGFGAILYKVDDSITDGNSLTLTKDLKVNGDESVKGNIDASMNITAKGNVECTNMKANSMITGNSPNTTITLTAAHAALIVAAGLSGTAAPLSGVQVMMQNN